MNPPVPAFDELTVEQRIDLVQSLWERIADAPEGVPLTDAQRDELDRRVQDHVATPDACSDWETVKTRLRTR